jgi:hypothetical protein
MELFGELLKIGGLPFALVCVALMALIRGDVIIKKSHEAIIKEKDEQIKREKERGGELWTLLQPAIVIGKASLDRLERREKEYQGERSGREGRHGGA